MTTDQSPTMTAPGAGYVHDLDTPLLMFSPADVWTLRDAAEGVLITGGIGSGKSSGSGAALAKAYLRAGFGGLVCCVNVDEVERWRRYCAETGRERSLIVVDGSLSERFNFLDYQMTVGRGSAFEAVGVLLDILNAVAGRYDTAEGGKDQFWSDSLRRMLRAAILPLWAAHGRITLAELMRFIHQRPKTRADLDPAGPWLDDSFWARTMSLAEQGGAHPMEPEDYQPVFDYWTEELIGGDDRTTGNILMTVTSRLDPFLTGNLRKLFCTDTTLVPELTFEAGAVIVLDLSAHAWGQEGIVGQQIFKVMWQRAISRRPERSTNRPAFLFCDECQYLMAASDQPYQSTARAKRALTVYLTQNLPGMFVKIGGPHPQNVVDALTGNLATKIAHAQPDPRTSEWMSSMIGKAVTWRQNVGESEGTSEGSNTSSGGSSGSGPGQHGSSSYSSGTQHGSNRGRSRGASQVVDYHLQPSHFTTLRKGGGADRMTEAVIFQAGRVFTHTRSTWTATLFKQG